jgi:ABC-type multidrug transport system fused ATPase/permease subunit
MEAAKVQHLIIVNHVMNPRLSPLVSQIPPCSAFVFPPVETMGQVAVHIEGLTHGYNGRTLFEDASLTIERGERVAIIGPNGALPLALHAWAAQNLPPAFAEYKVCLHV